MRPIIPRLMVLLGVLVFGIFILILGVIQGPIGIFCLGFGVMAATAMVVRGWELRRVEELVGCMDSLCTALGVPFHSNGPKLLEAARELAAKARRASKLSTLEAERARLEQELALLKSEAARDSDVAARLQTLQRRNQELVEELRRLREQVREFGQAAQQEKGAETRAIRDLKKRQREKLDALRGERDSERARAERAEDQIAQLQTNLQELQTEINRLRQLLDSEAQSRQVREAAVNAEMSDLRQTIDRERETARTTQAANAEQLSRAQRSADEALRTLTQHPEILLASQIRALLDRDAVQEAAALLNGASLEVAAQALFALSSQGSRIVSLCCSEWDSAREHGKASLLRSRFLEAVRRGFAASLELLTTLDPEEREVILGALDEQSARTVLSLFIGNPRLLPTVGENGALLAQARALLPAEALACLATMLRDNLEMVAVTLQGDPDDRSRSRELHFVPPQLLHALVKAGMEEGVINTDAADVALLIGRLDVSKSAEADVCFDPNLSPFRALAHFAVAADDRLIQAAIIRLFRRFVIERGGPKGPEIRDPGRSICSILDRNQRRLMQRLGLVFRKGGE